MDEVLFRSSQKIEHLQVQLSLAAAQSKDLLQEYSKQSKSAILQAWHSPQTEHVRENLRHFWQYIIGLGHELKDQIAVHVNPQRIYRNLARIFWRRWTKRDVYFLLAGFAVGSAVGVVLTITVRKKRPIFRYMQAIQCKHYLGIEAATVIEDAIAPNECGDDEVMINVKAASVQVIDAKICMGYGRTLRKILRHLYKSEFELPVTLGRDCSGIVTDIGRNVKRLEVGDEVWVCVPFWHEGTLSQTLLVSEHRVGRKPKNSGYEGACSLPYAGCLALTALKDARITPENAITKRILVQGGCTPVGCIIIQILRHWNAYVTTTCYRRAMPVAKALGASDIILCPEPGKKHEPSTPADSKANDMGALLKELELRDRFDCIIVTRDCGVSEKDFAAFCEPNFGTIVSTLPKKLPSDSYGFIGVYLLGNYIRFKYILEQLSGLTIDCYDDAHLCHVTLDEIAELVEGGHLQTVVDKVFHPQDIEMALSHIQSHESIGSTVITYR